MTVIFQKIGLEVLHCLLYYIILFINGWIVDFRSLKTSAHEIYWPLIVLITLFHKHSGESSVRRKGVEHKILLKYGFYRACASMMHTPRSKGRCSGRALV